MNADIPPLAQRIADFIEPELSTGENIEAILDRGRIGPPTWSGEKPYVDDIAGVVLLALFWGLAMLVSAVRYRTLVTRWYAVVATNRRVFFLQLRSVPGEPDGHPPRDMEPGVVEWIDARSAVNVNEIRFSGLSGLLRLGRPEGGLELSFDRTRLASAQAVALALGAAPELVRAGTASRRRPLAVLVDFALGFSLFGWLAVAFYVFRENGVLPWLAVVLALVVARFAIGRPYVTASGCLAAVVGFLASFIALGLFAVAVGF